MLAELRAFFHERGVLEVETSILSAAANPDPAIEPLCLDATLAPASSGRWYLQTSPEFPMKRLLAAGSGPIYQVCKVFRAAERGRRHHPEFTMLEWYRPGFSLDALMDEVAELVQCLLGRPIDVERVGYADLFRERLGLDPWVCSAAALQECATAAGIADATTLDLDADGWLDLLLTHCIESHLGRGRLTFVCGYPPSQAALARVHPGPPPTAARFELYLEGMELANGFDELSEVEEQRERFQRDLAARDECGQPPLPLDERLLAGLRIGLPRCCGVALGLDRLLMCATGAGHIDEVLAFPIERS
jgi:lysyl-tRNA synthetase class 2